MDFRISVKAFACYLYQLFKAQINCVCSQMSIIARKIHRRDCQTCTN